MTGAETAGAGAASATGAWYVLDSAEPTVLVGDKVYVQGRSFRRVLEPAPRHLLSDAIERCRATGQAVELNEVPFRGTAYRVRVQPINGPFGHLVGMLGYVGPAVDAPLPDPPATGGWEWDMDACTSSWSGELREMYGEPPGLGVRTLHAAEFVANVKNPPANHGGIHRVWMRAAEEPPGTLHGHTFEMANPRVGAPRTLAFYGRAAIEPEGRRFRGFSVDVTDVVGRHACRHACSAADPIITALVDLCADLVLIVRPAYAGGIVVYHSRDAEPFLGVPIPVSGKLREFTPEPDVADLAALEDRLHEGERAQWRFRVRQPDGGHRWLTAETVRVMTAGMLCVVRRTAGYDGGADRGSDADLPRGE